ncbi:MAG: alpha/beta hydrolase, partial [Thermocrispum sp.]
MTKLAARLPHSVQTATMRAVVRLPRPLKRLIAGKPIVLDGQTLALEAQVLLRMVALTEITLADGTVQEARESLELNSAVTVGPPLEVDARDLTIPTPDGTLPARLYSPRDVAGPAPLLVFFHGGGWVVGSINSHDYAARFLALHAGVRVLSVEYRLAPDHRFPAAVNDALAAFDHAYKHADDLGADQSRIAVGGDSAGGNLAAVVAQQAVRRGGPAPALQVLIYPEVDFAVRRPSRRLFAEGFF